METSLGEGKTLNLKAAWRGLGSVRLSCSEAEIQVVLLRPLRVMGLVIMMQLSVVTEEENIFPTDFYRHVAAASCINVHLLFHDIFRGGTVEKWIAAQIEESES